MPPPLSFRGVVPGGSAPFLFSSVDVKTKIAFRLRAELVEDDNPTPSLDNGDKVQLGGRAGPPSFNGTVRVTQRDWSNTLLA